MAKTLKVVALLAVVKDNRAGSILLPSAAETVQGVRHGFFRQR